jgi:basic membrane protein A
MVVVLAMGLLAGCTPQAPAVDVNRDQVTMVTDMGGINDKSFNQSAWEGLEKFGNEYAEIAVNYLESTTTENYVPNLSTAVEQGSDLTWAIGYMMADQLATVAGSNPDSKFAIIDSAPATAEDAQSNVAYVLFKEQEGSFLVGVIAGLTTQNNVVGFVGGMSGGLIEKFESGYRAGVASVNPDATVLVQYAESWTDDQKGEQIATTMINQGADVVYAAAGSVGVGVARACQAEEKWFIGVDKDQSKEFPDNPYVLTSMLKRVDQAVYDVTKNWADGKFNGGETLVLGLTEQGVGYVKDKVPEEIQAKADEYAAQIADGSLVVPASHEELATFVADLNK